jgi:hypothetical protein
MNIKGLRAYVELVASAKRIACGDGHSYPFRCVQHYIITENEAADGGAEGVVSFQVADNYGSPLWQTFYIYLVLLFIIGLYQGNLYADRGPQNVEAGPWRRRRGVPRRAV